MKYLCTADIPATFTSYVRHEPPLRRLTTDSHGTYADGCQSCGFVQCECGKAAFLAGASGYFKQACNELEPQPIKQLGPEHVGMLVRLVAESPVGEYTGRVVRFNSGYNVQLETDKGQQLFDLQGKAVYLLPEPS